MRILITGAKGQLGRDVVRAAIARGFEAAAFDRAALDIADTDAVHRALENESPDVVVNCAAYTAVDRAEEEPDLAMAVNRDGPANIAKACAQLSTPLIHISTDYVFDGRKDGPYVEIDPVGPLNVYGQTKLAGEEAIRQALDRHLIIRTSWLFGLHGHNFVKTMLRLGCEREAIKVVDDQFGCPTYSSHLAVVIVAIAARLTNGEGIAWGVYHYADQPAVSWHQFAAKIFDATRKAGLPLKLKSLIPIPTSEYPTPARRALNSMLDAAKITQDFNLEISFWEKGLMKIIDGFRP